MILGEQYIGQFLKDEPVRRRCSVNSVRGAIPDQINPASLNLRVGTTFLIPRKRFLSSIFGGLFAPIFGGVRLGSEMKYKRVKVKEGRVFHLRPGQFVLATTMEYVTLDKDTAAFVQGRSSIGRAGLTVQNAGFVDPGFEGAITLEFKNETKNTIDIPVGYPLMQLVYMSAQGVLSPYRGKYQGQKEATGTRMHLDKNKGL